MIRLFFMGVKVTSLNNFYIHSIIGPKKYTLKKLDSILNSGCIKSRSLQNVKDDGFGYHRFDDICLTDPTKSKIDHTYSAFDLFISNSISLILSKDIKVYRPIVKPKREISSREKVIGLCTNIYDEVRTRDYIGLEKVKGIIVPVRSLIESDSNFLLFSDLIFNLFVSCEVSPMSLAFYMTFVRNKLRETNKYREIDKVLKEINDLLKQHNLDIDIYDYDEEKKVKCLTHETKC